MKKKLAELIEMLCYDASGDEDERYIWRTIKKADSEGNGRRIKIDTETGKIVMGFGINFDSTAVAFAISFFDGSPYITFIFIA